MPQAPTESSPSPPPADPAAESPSADLPPIDFDGLPEKLRRAATRAGWSELMPVQSRAIPYLLAGRDVMVQSRTGSGKTGAFVLPILERIDPGLAQCQAMVLVPTRELAQQVARDAIALAGEDGVRAVPVYGGVGYQPQIDAFRKGAHLVVGTPGRILDHLMRGALTLEGLRVLIFDEADRMLSMGFYPDMKRVQRHLPRGRINSAMFSATFPPYVIRLANQFLTDPETLSLSADHVHVTEVEHVYYSTPGMDKDRALIRIIEMENPSSAIIFCNRKTNVHYVTVVLKRFGYDADELSSDLNQGQRERVMNRVRAGTLKFLVATDVAARGIDIPELSHVFQYDVPEDPEGYIHRAGRTGRAGAAGEAITLVSGMEKYELMRIAKRFGIDMDERPLPTDEDVQEIVSQRLTALLEARLRDRDKLQVERMQRFMPLVKALGESEDESALIAMLMDDFYQESLHAPAERTEPEPRDESRPPRPRGGGGEGRGRRRGGGGRR